MELNDEQALAEQLRHSRDRLDGLMRDLHTVEAELEDLSSERQQVELLEEVCGGLEKLAALGGAGLFWGGQAGIDNGNAQVRRAREGVDVFSRRVGEIDGIRLSVLEAIGQAQDDTEILEYDVAELEKEEEFRKLEWIVEREVSPGFAHELVMPWSRGGEDDERFRKSMVASLLLSLLLGFVLPQIDLPIPDRWEVIELPDRLTRLIKEEKQLPPPLPQEAKPRETVPESSEEAPKIAEEKSPEAIPQQAPEPSLESKGILAFREKFSGLAEKDPSDRLGAQARIDRSGELASGRPQRSMVATQAPGSSGGINVAALSRGVVGGSGGEIQGVEIGRATSSIGGGQGQGRPLSGGGPGLGRTDEEIQIVFDRHKSALYRLYNRELRRNPTLKGQMVLRLTIEPDGSVSLCELKSSDMDAPQLSGRVVGRVKTFDFGAKEGVATLTILYPIDFLPAA